MTRPNPERPATTARKTAILDGALKCFREGGVKQATIQDLQAAAGCSVGSIYHHFGSKEGVAEALFISLIDRFNQGMLTHLDTCSSAQACVEGVVHYYCDWAVAHPDEARYLHSRDIDFSANARRALREIYADYIRAVHARFAPHVLRGAIQTLPIDTYVPLISGPVQDYVRRWLAGQSRADLESVKPLFAQAAWASVAVQQQ